ncbi:DNA-binding Xre family transcriptional regulator [Microbacterium testaceum]|uniref:helix-turn-helix domain-containing protein n=1 Tax=Microbacterium TaxID=33882 RepID=UPI0027822332|nr:MULTISPECIES: helix-turn-helix transcriptional regulator [Microbacterium]MDQ1111092.1 DNA-binding Xre family transcriptional regulator [Microbacterium testaceum]MDR6098366.1 DNA-binding Xre family transcriptional regulator [Microbacterium sp. SORGH_AS_0454]
MNYTTPSGKASRAIRSILADRRESVEKLAEATGISLSTLKRRLLLASPFTIDELGLIAAHFNLSIIDVITPVDERILASSR